MIKSNDHELLVKVKQATLAMQRHDWEQGVVAQAFWESGDYDTACLLAVEGMNRQIADGRCCQLGGGQSSTDPCAIGSALIFAGKNNDPKLISAKERLIAWALDTAPRNADGIVYHLINKAEFWVDSL